MDIPQSDLTVQVYVRPALLIDPIDAKLVTLQSLEDDGVIDALLLQAWPEEITLSDQPPHSEAVEVFERFDRWAESRGVSVRPSFAVRTRTSKITGETKEILSTPVMCLAVYEGRRLAGVFPHSAGDDHHSVTEAIAALKTGDLAAYIPEPAESAEPGPRRCPECDGALVNVQGIDACHDCAWVDIAAGSRDRTRALRP